jgi:hypothetical protein
MKRSLLTISLVLIFLMMFSGSAFAQDPMPHVFCGELVEDDCAILVESQEAMMALTSGTTASEMSIFIAGIPDAPVDELAFNLSSNSAFTIDPAVTEMVAAMQGMSEEMMADPGALLEMMASLYGGVENEGEITIELSDGFVELLTADSGLDIPATFSIGMSIVDGVLYVNLGDLADVTPEAALLDAWYGIDMVELLGMLAEEAGALDPTQLNAMSTGLFFSAGMQGGNGAFDEFVEIERLEDDEIDDQTVAVFLSTFDFAGFLASPVFRDMVMMQMEQSGTPMDPEELDQTLSMVGLFAPMLLTDLDAGSVQVIGLEDYFLHQTQTYFNWDLSALAALAPDQFETAPMIEFEAFSENGDFNADIEIMAPEGALVIPTEVILTALEQ